MINQIIIPAQPRADKQTVNGRKFYDFAKAIVKLEAINYANTPIRSDHQIPITIACYYAQLATMGDADIQSPRAWHDNNISRPDSISGIILNAISGSDGILSIPSQANPLIVTRFVMRKNDLEAEFGAACRHGFVLIRWGYAKS